MSQKSITSFFSRAPSAKKSVKEDESRPESEGEKIPDTSPKKANDSPVKPPSGSKKRLRVIESDSEEEKSLNKSPLKIKKDEEHSALSEAKDNTIAEESILEASVEESHPVKPPQESEKENVLDGSKKSGKSEKKKEKKSVTPKPKRARATSEPKSSEKGKKHASSGKERKTPSRKGKNTDKTPKKSAQTSPISKNTSENEIDQIEAGSKTPEKTSESSPKQENESPEKEENKTPESAEGISESSPSKETSVKKTLQGFFTSSKKSSHDAPTKFNPGKSKFHPIDDAIWKQGEKVPYIALARTFEQIEGVSSRLRTVELLSNLLRSVIVLSPSDLLPTVYLCLNKLAPAYLGLELGIAETSLIKAICGVTGRSPAQVKSEVTTLGDLGLVAEQSKTSQRMMFTPPPLSVSSVFSTLKEIANMSGAASQGKKVTKIQSMLVACRGPEARYLMRSLAGKLRIGLAEQSVLQGLAMACVTTPPCQEYPPPVLDASKGLTQEKYKAKIDEAALILKTTYCECPNYDKLMPVLLSEGLAALPEHCKLTPGIPLKPMLAHPTKGVHEVLHRFHNLKFTCEWKYDGERAQIHMTDEGKVSIYSRNQEDNTSKYPDVVCRVTAVAGEEVKSCILDTEAVAWDLENSKIRPFQVLTTRKRKDAAESEIKVAVCMFMFDLLYLNGRSLVKEPLAERRRLLKQHFRHVEGQWHFATSLDSTTTDDIQAFLEDSVKGNCEGLMVKTLEEEATYEIAKRSRNWLKLKKDYLEGVGDSLDVVPIGGFLGKGKRTGVYGGFLLACYDPQNDEYQSLCKIGTGFSEEDLQKLSGSLKEHIVDAAKSYYRYDSSVEPDVWFEPVQVWEVKCADLSLSPVHRAAIGIADAEKGISLRFPRFLRVREDKAVEDATSANQIADMYRNQEQIKNQQGDNTVKEEDFY